MKQNPIFPSKHKDCMEVSFGRRFNEANKENYSVSSNVYVTESKVSPSDLPEVIQNLSRALETSNNNVQSLKTQLEIVLKRESTLQTEYEGLTRKLEKMTLAKSQVEAQSFQKDNDTERKIEELKEIIKQKNKTIEVKNAEIEEFTKKMHSMIKEHKKEVTLLNNEMREVKEIVKYEEEKRM